MTASDLRARLGRARRWGRSRPRLTFSLFLLLSGACSGRAPISAEISVDSSLTYQSIRGWEAAITSTALDHKPFLPALDTLYHEAANDLGVTRLRISVQAGTERPPGYGEQYLAGAMPESTLVRYYGSNPVNDNDDPNVADTTRFDFALIDWRMEHIVLPLRRRVEARGEKFYGYLSYTDFAATKFEHGSNPAEYAEFMLVLFQHLDEKYGWVPNGVNVINEPDLADGWTPELIGPLIVATAERLAKAGYHPDFMAPATEDRGRAAPFFDVVVRTPGAARYLVELPYHCYHDSGRNSREEIGERTVRYGVASVMNECWRSSNDYEELHADLQIARNSAWQLGGLHGRNGYYAIDRGTWRVSLNPRTKLIRQYIKFIRPGARRIGAITSHAALDPLAFVNRDGSFVVVIKADGPGEATVTGLPPATYSISYTTETEFDIRLPDAALATGRSIRAAIPARGVLTIRAEKGETHPERGHGLPQHTRSDRPGSRGGGAR